MGPQPEEASGRDASRPVESSHGKGSQVQKNRSQGLVIEAETTADRSLQILSAHGVFTVCLRENVSAVNAGAQRSEAGSQESRA